MYRSRLEYDKWELGFINAVDPEIAAPIENERKRQQHIIELIASENIVSRTVRAAQGCILTNKYAEGYPEKRYYGGCENADRIESLAISRACRLFNAHHVNVQAHSGSQANMAAYFALIDPGDTILFDTNGPTVTSGIRMGTSAVTTRGMGKDEMALIAWMIAGVLHQPDDNSCMHRIHDKVSELCKSFPLPENSEF